MAAAIACASMMPAGSASDGSRSGSGGGQTVRIALATAASSGRIGGSGSWRAYDRGGDKLIGEGAAGRVWSVSSDGSRIRVTRDGSTSSYSGPLVVRAPDASFAMWNDKRYRGELVISSSDSGLLVVNRLPVESYLRGVVPLEIGARTADEHAAVEAQAVAARSYSYVHLAPSRGYDMMGTVQDQVYGGVDAERPFSDAAVSATAGEVVKYAGLVVNTPYHSTCGGRTAAVHEVWYNQPDEPYLRPVSDRIPGTDRFYCDSSPRFSWTTTFDNARLNAVLAKYLAGYARVSSGGVGRVTGVYEQGRTESGRVESLRIQTDRGAYTLRGNDIRFVLRNEKNEILNSTSFTTEQTISNGEVSNLTLEGHGYGHGIGMCQWGAIGRARAGQSYRTILTTYYPGTTVSRM